ncbi:hypothetical protein MMC19_006491 [Ptychographa xylographoides]|nr:hypothetical protein [Ptychographa xylographoides]
MYLKHFLLPMFSASVFPSPVAAAAAATISNTSSPSYYRLRLDPLASGLGNNWQGGTDIVSYANGTLWIGAITYEIYAEPLILTGSSEPATSLLFTSYHSAPTGSQYVALLSNATGPVVTTVPHSFVSPYGGLQLLGFGFDATGRLGFWNQTAFFGCRSAVLSVDLETYQIWWLGQGSPPNSSACVGPLYLYQDTGCSLAA